MELKINGKHPKWQFPTSHMSCYSCRAKVSCNNTWNHHTHESLASAFTYIWRFAPVFSQSGSGSLRFSTVFASGRYLVEESLLDFPNRCHWSSREKSSLRNLICSKILIKMMLCIFTFPRAKNTETYLHLVTTKRYKLLYKMQSRLKKNKVWKVRAV